MWRIQSTLGTSFAISISFWVQWIFVISTVPTHRAQKNSKSPMLERLHLSAHVESVESCQWSNFALYHVSQTQSEPQSHNDLQCRSNGRLDWLVPEAFSGKQSRSSGREDGLSLLKGHPPLAWAIIWRICICCLFRNHVTGTKVKHDWFTLQKTCCPPILRTNCNPLEQVNYSIIPQGLIWVFLPPNLHIYTEISTNVWLECVYTC